MELTASDLSVQQQNGGASTKKEVLQELLKQPSCPVVVRHILEYRSNATIVNFLEDIKSRMSTARPFPSSQVSQTGGVLLRISGRVQQTVASTGRLSMDEPNLQVLALLLTYMPPALLVSVAASCAALADLL